MKSWSSFGVGLVLGIVLTAAVFLLRGGERSRPAVTAAAGVAEKSRAAPAAATGDVVINGAAFTQRHKDEFAKRYGVAPVPGAYWYDAESGLWGLPGQAASGFLLPGHDFGVLAANASSGHTGIFVNGREMPETEVLLFASLVGAVMPGRYWLDGTGNYGYEGLPMPAGNLYVMAAASGASGSGGGGGGDNFWSSRFARGNYNEDNSMGYVSLPGGGTVSYGM